MRKLEKLALEFKQNFKKQAVERKNSKQLQRDIELAKNVYNTTRQQLDDAEKEMELLQVRISGLRGRKNQAYSKYSQLNKAMQDMQLSGASEVRFRGESDISYVKDKKEYRLEVDNEGNMKLHPYRTRKKKEEVIEKEGDENQVEDMDEGEEVNPEFFHQN